MGAHADMNKACTLVAIGGGSASGKTTVASKISRLLGEERAVILEMDSYYKDLSHLSDEERAEVNFDHPKALDFDLFKAHLKRLRSGNGIDKPVYNFHTHKLEAKTILFEPKKYIIVEGLFVLLDILREEFHFRIYIDTPEEARIARRIDRDTKERGRTKEAVLKQYESTVKPMHEAFVVPSAKNADLVINWEKEDLGALERIVKCIKAL